MISPLRTNRQNEGPQKAAIDHGSDGQRDLDSRVPLTELDEQDGPTHKQCGPGKCEYLPRSERPGFVVLGAGPGSPKVVRRSRCERVDRRRERRHRGCKDTRDDEPADPRAEFFHNKPSENLVGRVEGPAFVVNPKAETHDQKQQKLAHHHDTASNQRLLARFYVPTGEQPLHEELVGTMRRHREDGTSKHARPNRIRQREVERPVQNVQLTRLTRATQNTRPPVWREHLKRSNRNHGT